MTSRRGNICDSSADYSDVETPLVNATSNNHFKGEAFKSTADIGGRVISSTPSLSRRDIRLRVNE
jgi:hypothetical protein